VSREADAWVATWGELSEASDRAVGVLGQAILEEYLRILVAARLVESPESMALLAPNGRTISLARLSRLAYSLGLITEKQHAQLRAITKIRNHFAHNLDAASFDDVEIARPMSHLDHYAGLLGNREDSPRNRFTGAVAALAYALVVETQTTEHEVKREERVNLLEILARELGV